LEQLKRKTITDFKSYIFNEEVKNGKEIEEYLRCMDNL